MDRPTSPSEDKVREKVNHSTTHTSFMISDILDSRLTRTARSKNTTADIEDKVGDRSRDGSHSPMSVIDHDSRSDGRPEVGEGNMSSDGETEKSGCHGKQLNPRVGTMLVL